jgi:diguanylate cyclase (GGDEF)-like protein/PAS domain S-box-containing protein
VCTFTEVTEAANSTKAIGDSERLFRQLAEFTNDLVCRIDQRGFVSYVSPSMERALGWADLHGSYLTQCIDPEYRSAYAQPITAIIRGETDAEQAEFDLLTSDGRRVTVDASLVGIDVWGRRGAQRTGAVVTMRDITERRALEAARHDAEVLFAQVFNNSPVGLALTSLISGEPLVVDCNPSYAELFGLEREELLGVNLLDFTHPDDWELSVSGRSELMSGDVDRNEVELRVIRRGGEVIWCSVKRSLARGRTGEPRYIIAQATDITQQRAQAEHIRSLALTDVLTGLPNRRLLLERLEHALARRERSLDPVAVLFLDLDHFKAVNDSLGHEAGDELLRDVGEALTESVRSSDTVARLGGDEFAVIIEALPEDDVRLIVERIARNLRFDRRLPDGAIVTVTASIGVAWASLGRDGAAVLRRADGAMYRAKQSGRNQTVYA